MNMVKAVIFDMYETLITLHAAPLYFSAEMAADAGIAVEDFRRAWYPSEKDRMLGRVDFAGALRPVLEHFGCCTEELLAAMVARRTEAKRASFDHLHPQILPMLRELKERGVSIGLITNCFLEEEQFIRQSELFPFFSAAMLSCSEGLAKPDRAIYHRCMEALGVEAECCLYIGDGGSRELETAREVGMRAAQATWYLREGTNQPTGRKPGFVQLDAPMNVLELL